jgi:IS30 family transposase
VPSQWLSEADLQALGLSADDLARIHRRLNDRLRKTLGYMTPLEKFVEVVALSS